MSAISAEVTFGGHNIGGCKGAAICGAHSFNKLSLSIGLGTEHTAGNKTDEDEGPSLMGLPVWNCRQAKPKEDTIIHAKIIDYGKATDYWDNRGNIGGRGSL